jgi:membrane protease subunit (stomatin/prohibitin family)
MPIIDFVKWTAREDIYAWKYPSQELSTWTQLVVAESQEAVLVKEGRALAVFRAGRHTLDTANIPLLVDLVKIPFGGKSPFTAEVWFVNRTIPLDVKWGTQDPIQLQDPKFGIMLPVRAFGQYGVQIENTNQFLQKLVGTLPAFDRAHLNSYFRGLFLTRAKTTISQYLVQQKVSILEISAHLDEISNKLRDQMAGELETFGLRLVTFFVNSINAPEDDPAVARLKSALAKRAEMNIVGYTYQQERSFDTMESAASNPGTGQPGLMGAGIGLAMGVAFGNAIGPSIGQIGQHLQPSGQTCPKCSAPASSEARFCPVCATPLSRTLSPSSDPTVCIRCGTSAPAKTKYCPGCGRAFFCCVKCDADNLEDDVSCVKCGHAFPVRCPHCHHPSPVPARFCGNCGKSISPACDNCGTSLTSGMKFCGTCGKPVEGAG